LLSSFLLSFLPIATTSRYNDDDDHDNNRGPSLLLPLSGLMVASWLHPPLPRQQQQHHQHTDSNTNQKHFISPDLALFLLSGKKGTSF
jgi:hypothetical protein